MITSDYRLPAEFEAHKATWLLWPTRADNWRCNGYFGQNDIRALVGLIAHFEPVRLGVRSSDSAEVQKQVPPSVTVVEMDFNDVWVRDTGPTTIVSDSKPALAINWRFNSWGGLFSEVAEDGGVASDIARYERLASVKAPIVLEGGAIISDGKGTIIATEESVLAENRNPGLTRSEAEDIFRQFLNAQSVIWLPLGLNHDEAGGHVDNICAFASPRVLLVASTRDTTHPSYDRVGVAKDILSRSSNALGHRFSIVEVPLPDATFITDAEAAGFASARGTIVRTGGSPLAPSHINFYTTKGAVFVPTFNSPSDKAAIDIISETFPDRQIVPYQSREFLLGGGAIHCLTKEIPT